LFCGSSSSSDGGMRVVMVAGDLWIQLHAIRCIEQSRGQRCPSGRLLNWAPWCFLLMLLLHPALCAAVSSDVS
jgi:hypothetical protein